MHLDSHASVEMRNTRSKLLCSLCFEQGRQQPAGLCTHPRSLHLQLSARQSAVWHLANNRAWPLATRVRLHQVTLTFSVIKMTPWQQTGGLHGLLMLHRLPRRLGCRVSWRGSYLRHLDLVVPRETCKACDVAEALDACHHLRGVETAAQTCRAG